jgi:hypothetical protein
MTDFYTKLQGTATRLLTKFNQGTIEYVDPGTPTGDEWNPIPGTPTAYSLNATASGVSDQYVDGTTVLASDLMVNAAVFDIEPSMKGTVTIDGKTHQIIRIIPKPAAGVTVAWGIIVRA